MAQILCQQRELFITLPLNLGGSVCITPLEAISVEKEHLGSSGLAGFAQRADQRWHGPERTPHMAFPHVVEALSKALFNERLGGQNHPVAIQFNFEIIPGLQSQLIVNPLGNDDLSAHADLDGQCGAICP